MTTKLNQLYNAWTEEQQEEFLSFHEFPSEYLHHANAKFDTGLKLNLLQDYVMIPLDIYKQIYHNKIKTKPCTKKHIECA